MRVNMLFRPAIFVLMLFFSALTFAQDAPGWFEVGGNFTALRFRGDGFYGVGVDGDINFGRHIALDGSYSWLPNSPVHHMTGLFGAKVGARTGHFGFFGKVRPGFISISRELRSSSILVDPGPPAVTLATAAHVTRLTERALDLGGVVEYYPSRHWALRWDFGDTLVFQEQPTFTIVDVGSPPVIITFPEHTSNNFQFSTAIHYRF